MVSVPAPRTRPPMQLMKFCASMISGSLAALRITVSPVGYRRGHHQVLGRPDAGQVQVISAPCQLRGPPVDVAVPLVNDGPQRSQAGEVQVDGPGADGAPAGLGDLNFAQPAQQRAHHLDGRPHRRTAFRGTSGWRSLASMSVLPSRLAVGAQPFQDLDHVSTSPI